MLGICNLGTSSTFHRIAIQKRPTSTLKPGLKRISFLFRYQIASQIIGNGHQFVLAPLRSPKITLSFFNTFNRYGVVPQRGLSIGAEC